MHSSTPTPVHDYTPSDFMAKLLAKPDTNQPQQNSPTQTQNPASFRVSPQTVNKVSVYQPYGSPRNSTNVGHQEQFRRLSNVQSTANIGSPRRVYFNKQNCKGPNSNNRPFQLIKVQEQINRQHSKGISIEKRHHIEAEQNLNVKPWQPKIADNDPSLQTQTEFNKNSSRAETDDTMHSSVPNVSSQREIVKVVPNLNTSKLLEFLTAQLNGKLQQKEKQILVSRVQLFLKDTNRFSEKSQIVDSGKKAENNFQQKGKLNPQVQPKCSKSESKVIQKDMFDGAKLHNKSAQKFKGIVLGKREKRKQQRQIHSSIAQDMKKVISFLRVNEKALRFSKKESIRNTRF